MPTSKDLKDLDSQLKKTVISAESFKRGSSFDSSKSIANIHKTISSLAGHTRKLVMRVSEIEKTVNNNSRKITSLKNISKTQSERIGGTNIGAKLPGASGSSQVKEIINVLDEIINALKLQNTQQKKSSDTKRKEAESAKRGLAESALEKGFKGAIKVAEKVLAPVKSLLSRIIDYFIAIFLGRSVFKLLEWFGNPENKSKINSIFRFLSATWPAILSAFLIFGTGLGGFVANITGILIRAVGALASRNPAVLGTLIGGGLLAGAVKLSGNNKPEDSSKVTPDQQQKPEEQQQKKEELPVQKFAGGGLASLFGGLKEGLMKNKALSTALGAATGAAFGPFGAILGAVAGNKGGDVMQHLGLITGEKGVDKIPAMLSDGEFVMSRGAVQKYGVDQLEAMNAAGGGTNRPKVMKGKVFAKEGGYIGKKDTEGYKKESDGIYSGGLIADRKEELSQREIAKRLKRIEQQMQVQKALASGSGINIKGAGLGSDIGKGFATTFMGREAIKVSLPPGGSYEDEITLAGKRYFAMKKGNEVIYVSQFAKGLAGQVDKYGAKNKSYRGGGGGLMSGLSSKDKKNLPKTKIMMGPDGPFVGYLTYKNGEPSYQRPTQRKKGMLESLADFFNPKGAKAREETLNARTLRITGISDLEDMRRRGMKEENIKKMLNERLGANGYSRAVNDLKAKQSRIKKEDSMKKITGSSSVATGNTNIGVSGLNKPNVSNLGPNYKQKELQLASAANKPKLKTPAPPPQQQVKVKSTKNTANRRGLKPSSGGKPKVPNFGASCPASNAPKNKKILGIF